jgi:hypothetical protein
MSRQPVSLHSCLLAVDRGTPTGSSKRGCERCEGFSGKIVRKKKTAAPAMLCEVFCGKSLNTLH